MSVSRKWDAMPKWSETWITLSRSISRMAVPAYSVTSAQSVGFGAYGRSMISKRAFPNGPECVKQFVAFDAEAEDGREQSKNHV